MSSSEEFSSSLSFPSVALKGNKELPPGTFLCEKIT
uniref:Uncharacterized protein n=1 Tax=Heterorhabditis bacteriophora TaxID=37862 RepID=A0A1I7X1W4_HETBA